MTVENPTIKLLREERERSLANAKALGKRAQEYEVSARSRRAEEAEALAFVAAADRAIADLEAADRRHRIYGKEVVQ